ncbi:hypothetical protein JQM83_14245 [Parabacteroides distasonis]|nr:hypothetical protein [Parabacteroides distasonis]
MSNIRFRLAKPSDAKQIADCHWHVRDRYTTGIFLSLGKGFLKAYYEIMLNDPNEIIVCAENSAGEIVGFSSGSLDAVSQSKTIRSNKIKLGFAAMMGIIKHPTYLKGVWQRYTSLDNKSNRQQYLHMEGARSEYLCWKKGADGSINMMLLDKIKFKIMAELGVKEVFFEIDRHNERLFKTQERDKSITLLTEYQLPDGRTRGLFKKVLTK